MTDVVNCPYVGEFYDIYVLVNDNSTEMAYEDYFLETTQGSIPDLSVTFEGTTHQVSATAYF